MLKVSELTICFPSLHRNAEPVQNLSFELRKEEILGLFGPSGAGKTVLCTSLLGMLEHPGYIKHGTIHYTQETTGKTWDLQDITEAEWRHIRGKEIAMIPQNPMQWLNHSRTIRSQFIETIRTHRQGQSKQECAALAEAMLGEVLFSKPKHILEQYPFELSGGMCQRVLIAMSLIHHPGLLIADEPTTALDMKNQRAVLQLFKRIRETYHTAILLVSHDEQIISHNADQTLGLPSGPW